MEGWGEKQKAYLDHSWVWRIDWCKFYLVQMAGLKENEKMAHFQISMGIGDWEWGIAQVDTP